MNVVRTAMALVCVCGLGAGGTAKAGAGVAVLDLEKGSFLYLARLGEPSFTDKAGRFIPGAMANAKQDTAGNWRLPGFDASQWTRPYQRVVPAPKNIKVEKRIVHSRGVLFGKATKYKRIQLRGAFRVTDPARVKGLRLDLQYIGGAVVYLNGEEVLRGHKAKDPNGPDDSAEPYPPEAYIRADGELYNRGERPRNKCRERVLPSQEIPAGKLRKGVNVLSVELYAAPISNVMLTAPCKQRNWMGIPRCWSHVGLVSARLTANSGAGLVPSVCASEDIEVANCGTLKTLRSYHWALPQEKLYPIRIAGIRSSAASGQLLLSSKQPIKELKGEVSALKCAAGGATLTAEAVQVRYATTGKGTGFNQFADKAPAEFPGRNFARFRFARKSAPRDLGSVAAVPVCVTVSVPADAKAGIYTGTLSISASGPGNFKSSVPLRVEVPAAEGQDAKVIPLTGLPSKEGPLVAKIKAMPENSWFALGRPSPDPKWGEGLGRAWGSKMPYAPAMRGAFLAGEGRHGGTATRNGKRHYNDDVYFYDINAHRWICVYPGLELGKYNAKVNEHGFEVDRDGHPLPIAWMVHAYNGVTYDADRREFLTCHNPSGGGYWRRSMPLRTRFLKELDAQRKAKKGKTGNKNTNRYKGISPWIYRVDKGHWDRKRTETRSPRLGHGCHYIYMPWRKEVFVMGRPPSLYNPAENKWTQPKPAGPFPPSSIDSASCLDTKRKRIYVAMNGNNKKYRAKNENLLWAYDVEKNTWIDLQAKGKLPPLPKSVEGVNGSTMHYNSVCDKVLYFAFGADMNGTFNNRNVYAYDPVKNEWELAWKGMVTNSKHHAFYDPRLNVHFIFTASDSGGGGKMWVYRYKKAKQK